MAATVYVLCTLTSLLCTALLLRAYARNRVRLLLWGGLCFAGLAANNAFLFVDLIVLPDIDSLDPAGADLARRRGPAPVRAHLGHA